MELTRPSGKTESLHGSEKILKKTLETFGWVSQRFDACLDHLEVSLHITHNQIWSGLLKLKNDKSVRIRILTEITEENLANIKKFMEVGEIKHLDDIRTNFGLADGKQYLGYTISRLDQSLSHGITSNVKELVEAQQYLFEILWNAAVPAEIRMEQLGRNLPIEKTEILYGQENIVRHFLHDLKYVQERFDSCTDFTGPSLFVDTSIWADYTKLQKRGIRLRFITEITKENIKYCEKLQKVCELRHLDKVKGNFGVIDGRSYGAGSSAGERQVPAQLVRSNVRAFVEQQQYFFETLWSKAVPAERKIEQIQKGMEEEFIDTIKDPYEAQRLGHELIKNSRNEIMIIFSTSNAFLRQVRAGTFKLLEQVATYNGVRIRILSPSNRKIQTFAKKYNDNTRQYYNQISIRHLKEDLQTRISLLLVDRKFCLAVELKDDMKDSSVEAIGYSTYSNSKSTVLSYASIFETLWRQSELYQRLEGLNEELRIRDIAQREFINTAAHELRTPIQPILGLSDLVLKKNKDKDLHEYLTIIARNAERLHRLTNNILDVTKIESKTLKLNKERINLDTLLSSLVIEYQTAIEKREVGKGGNHSNNSNNSNNNISHIELNYKFTSDLGPVLMEIDKDKIVQVITNLLNNALKSTRSEVEGSNEILPIEVSMKKDAAASEVIITICDRGAGIDQGMKDRLFTKFVTTSEVGTGLGLYLSKNLVEAHGGRIWAYNNLEGRGATFSFTLPLTINEMKPQSGSQIIT